jgi:hypothetical protein
MEEVIGSAPMNRIIEDDHDAAPARVKTVRDRHPILQQANHRHMPPHDTRFERGRPPTKFELVIN